MVLKVQFYPTRATEFTHLQQPRMPVFILLPEFRFFVSPNLNLHIFIYFQPIFGFFGWNLCPFSGFSRQFQFFWVGWLASLSNWVYGILALQHTIILRVGMGWWLVLWYLLFWLTWTSDTCQFWMVHWGNWWYRDYTDAYMTYYVCLMA